MPLGIIMKTKWMRWDIHSRNIAQHVITSRTRMELTTQSDHDLINIDNKYYLEVINLQ